MAPPFAPKTGPRERLAQSNDRFFAEFCDGLGKADGCYSFAFAVDRWRDRGDKDQLAFGRNVGSGKPVQSDLGRVTAVGF